MAIKREEDLARKIIVGTVVGYEYPPSFYRLRDRGLIEIEACPSEELNLKKLAAGRIDAALIKHDRPHHGHNQRDDLHLRSTKAVAGYEIQASDGPIGHVISLTVDDKSWALGELVVETGHWYAGKEILISTRAVERISYDESKVFVKLSRAAIRQTAEDDVVKAGT